MAQPADSRAGGDIFPRIASAAVLAPAALAIAYIGTPAFEITLAGMACVLAWEWTRLCGSSRPAVQTVVLALIATASLLSVAVGLSRYAPFIILGGAAVAFLAEGANRRAWMAGGAVYIALPLTALEWIRIATPAGRDIVLWMLLVVWASDTFAYIVGRGIGGPKLAPAISPKKTWAGLGGAIVGAAGVGALIAVAMESNHIVLTTTIAAALGAIGQCGDLLESAIKRHFQVKDASQLIPGHGGLLDRVDALLAAIAGIAIARAAGWQGAGAW